jgi:hypothetical protein
MLQNKFDDEAKTSTCKQTRRGRHLRQDERKTSTTNSLFFHDKIVEKRTLVMSLGPNFEGQAKFPAKNVSSYKY